MGIKHLFSSTHATIKRTLHIFLPKNIFSRFLLLIILPIIILQSLSLYVFFGGYWRTSSKIANEILVVEIKKINDEFNSNYRKGLSLEENINKLNKLSNFKLEFLQFTLLEDKDKIEKNIFKQEEYEIISIANSAKYLKRYLSAIKEDTYLVKKGKFFTILIKKEIGILSLEFNVERAILDSPYEIILWNILPSIILCLISLIFIKNQVQSIKKLTKVINEFSFLEKTNDNFKPTGAVEIREIGVAFLHIEKKIKRFIDTRTIMLAEISHDLRTPITRMKLEIEFIEDKELKAHLKNDLNEMGKMINEYLNFTKNENENDFVSTDIKDFFIKIVEEYGRSQYKNIQYDFKSTQQNIFIKYNSFKRAINNLINNSLKYGKNILITVSNDKKNLYISIEDDGIGLDKSLYKKINKSFYSLNQGNNQGFGLGLSIVQNTVDIHFGSLFFKKSAVLGGLSANIKIPLIQKIGENNDRNQ